MSHLYWDLRTIFDEAIDIWHPLQASANRSVSSVHVELDGTLIRNKDFDVGPGSDNGGENSMGGTYQSADGAAVPAGGGWRPDYLLVSGP